MAKLDQATPSVIPTTTRRFALPKQMDNFGQTYGALAALLILLIYNIFYTHGFFSFQELYLILTQVAPTVIIATGMTLVIATGGIDLSVGSLMAVAGALAPFIFLSHSAPLNNPFVGTLVGVVVALLVTSLFGLFNGILVTAFRIQPIIATLVLLIAGRGIAQALTSGAIQNFQNPGFQFIGQGKILGLPFQGYLMVVILLIALFLVTRTIFGRYLLATGGNENASRLAGVPVNRIKITVYIISGFLAGVAGLVSVAINSASAADAVGLNSELDAIAAVAVGGTSLIGGQANIPGTLVGALIIQIIHTTLVSHNVSDSVARVINAAIILLAVLIQRQRKS